MISEESFRQIRSECNDTMSFLPVNMYFHTSKTPCSHRHHMLSVRSIRLCKVVYSQSQSATNEQQLPFTFPPVPKQWAYAAFTPCPNPGVSKLSPGEPLSCRV